MSVLKLRLSYYITLSGLEDIPSTGCYYTWTNKRDGLNRVCSKIDRVLANDKCLSLFPTAEVYFMPEGLFDHSPGLFSFHPDIVVGRRVFKYCNMWSLHPDFLKLIADNWTFRVDGTPMYVLVRKLKNLKPVLRKLNRDGFSDVGDSDSEAAQRLKDCQRKLHADPHNLELINAEREANNQYMFAHSAYLSFLRQKSKLMWLKDGDANTRFFHASIRMRQCHSSIHSIENFNGVIVNQPEDVANAFVDYYKVILGTSVSTKSVKPDIVALGPIVNENMHAALTADFTSVDVHNAIFSIAVIQIPGPDCIGSQFFKDAWHLVGDDVVKAVLNFFRTGKLLKEVNSTSISLIPKTYHPTHVSQFRPISCCSLLYKCITKMLCSRMKLVLPQIVSPNQSGFVANRKIVHNITVIEDLLRQYGRKHAPSAFLVKIYLRKAYDTVEWKFLHEMLVALNFPSKLIDWIMVCVTSPRLIISLNGSLHGYFFLKGKED